MLIELSEKELRMIRLSLRFSAFWSGGLADYKTLADKLKELSRAKP